MSPTTSVLLHFGISIMDRRTEKRTRFGASCIHESCALAETGAALLLVRRCGVGFLWLADSIPECLMMRLISLRSKDNAGLPPNGVVTDVDALGKETSLASRFWNCFAVIVAANVVIPRTIF